MFYFLSIKQKLAYYAKKCDIITEKQQKQFAFS